MIIAICEHVDGRSPRGHPVRIMAQPHCPLQIWDGGKRIRHIYEEGDNKGGREGAGGEKFPKNKDWLLNGGRSRPLSKSP